MGSRETALKKQWNATHGQSDPEAPHRRACTSPNTNSPGIAAKFLCAAANANDDMNAANAGEPLERKPRHITPLKTISSRTGASASAHAASDAASQAGVPGSAIKCAGVWTGRGRPAKHSAAARNATVTSATSGIAAASHNAAFRSDPAAAPRGNHSARTARGPRCDRTAAPAIASSGETDAAIDSANTPGEGTAGVFAENSASP